MHYPDRVLSLGPVRYWRLGREDAVFGDFARDLSGGGHGAVAVGQVGDDPGGAPTDRLARATHFDGTNDRITVDHASALAITGDLSIVAAMYRTDPTTASRNILAKTDAGTGRAASYRAWTTENDLGLSLGTTGAETASSVVTSSTFTGWFLYGVTVSSTTVTFYRDGAQVGSPVANAAARTDGGTPLYIGGRGNATERFLGWLQDVALFNYALTADNMAILYADWSRLP